MSTLAEALATSYRALMGDTELSRAFYGGQGYVWPEPSLIATDYFTNPNLVGDGTWAEVRRNLFRDPFADQVFNNFAVSTPLTLTKVPGWGGAANAARATRNTLSNAGRFGLILPAYAPSTQYAFRVKVRASEAITGVETYVRPHVGMNTDQIRTYAIPSTIPAGESEFTGTFTTSTAAAGAAPGIALIYSSGTLDSTLDITAVVVEAGAVAGTAFDGNTKPAGIVQPEDLRVRWLGTPNASESVMEGERVARLGTFNAVGIVSTKAGKRAVRVIPTAASNGSNLNFAIPTPLLSGGVFCATIHLDAPLIGTLNGSTRIITAQNPFKASEMAPNAAGSLSQRVEFGALTGAVGALRHGGSIGSGDVWWTDIGLLTAGYTGPAFRFGQASPQYDGAPTYMVQNPDGTTSLWGYPEAVA